jgi:hypothetical protein
MLVVGVIVGFVLGMFLGPMVLRQTGAGTDNQVQVSGTVNGVSNSTISFSNSLEVYYNNSIQLIETSSSIVNGQYGILLIGGHSYTVKIGSWMSSGSELHLYVPLGVTTFTANF